MYMEGKGKRKGVKSPMGSLFQQARSKGQRKGRIRRETYRKRTAGGGGLKGFGRSEKSPDFVSNTIFTMVRASEKKNQV